jgi:hypothetical protein
VVRKFLGLVKVSLVLDRIALGLVTASIRGRFAVLFS